MKKIILPFLVLSLALLGCKKDKGFSCDHAVVCVTNLSGNVVYYGWNTSFYTDSLLPGQKACKDVGYISITRTEESTTTITFNSTRGSFAIYVDECNIEKSIN
ncbi:MAG: hypothetical protein JNL69_06225 [Bacteroidia bacterium]|nr:hypothetical protein [Bacteroidia bacterium]